ncbi:MAG: hypothetical protein F4Z06_14100 [Acidimicrobiia bacterium]|nr:hypothetical protein [Acidimicrobiia bacterium]MYE72054.1 hypothetical protein [Acidimicrobiia bacterium]MYH71366.1 hypothetical protein [Acidimicrobiia bacterium]MYJ63017.1 hypothetical protein [Acidimicrobiia bacterium]MYL09407.1 hypothetical protein [Acidimicrobiia bacterium]
MDPADRHVMLVFTNPVIGQEDQYYRWYDVHLHEVVSCHGVVSGRRYRMSPDPDLLTPEWMRNHADRRDLPMPFEYLAIYEIEGDLAAAVQAITTKDDYSIRSGDSLDHDTVAMWAFTQAGAQIGTAKPTEVDHLGISLANPTKGNLEWFEHWYTIHYREVMATPGFLTGRRYWATANVLTPQWAVDHGEVGTNGMPFQHLVVYEVGTRYAEAKPALEEQRKNFTVFPDGSMDYGEIIAWRYTPLA